VTIDKVTTFRTLLNHSRAYHRSPGRGSFLDDGRCARTDYIDGVDRIGNVSYIMGETRLFSDA
jgi:hypothetical protein